MTLGFRWYPASTSNLQYLSLTPAARMMPDPKDKVNCLFFSNFASSVDTPIALLDTTKISFRFLICFLCLSIYFYWSHFLFISHSIFVCRIGTRIAIRRYFFIDSSKSKIQLFFISSAKTWNDLPSYVFIPCYLRLYHLRGSCVVTQCYSYYSHNNIEVWNWRLLASWYSRGT